MATNTRIKLTERKGKGFTRDLGWKVQGDGRRVQHRFLLGTDRRKAERACLLLEQLWAEVVDIAKAAGHDPAWTPRTLAMAESIRKGEQFKVSAAQVNDDEDDPIWIDAQYAQRVDAMRTQHKSAAVIPADADAFRRGQAIHPPRHRQPLEPPHCPCP